MYRERTKKTMSIGIGELVIILVVIVILCSNPDKLPEYVRTISKAVADIRAISKDAKENMHEIIQDLDDTAKDIVNTTIDQANHTTIE